MLLALLGGAAALFHDPAAHALLVDLVPPHRLMGANVQLEQGRAAAKAVGPIAAGALIGAIGAPLAVLADAVAHCAIGALLAGLSHRAAPAGPHGQTVRQQGQEGLRWLYRHPRCAGSPYTNLWFVFHAAVTALVVPLALLNLGLGASAIGVVLAAAGTGLSAAAARRWGPRG